MEGKTMNKKNNSIAIIAISLAVLLIVVNNYLHKSYCKKQFENASQIDSEIIEIIQELSNEVIKLKMRKKQ